MKLTNFFLSALSLAALLTSCNNDAPDSPDPIAPADGTLISVGLRVADEPASRGVNDESLTPTANEAVINNAVVLIYERPLNATDLGTLKVLAAIYFTFSKSENGVWQSPGVRAEDLNLDLGGTTRYYATAIANCGNIADQFKGMSLTDLREYEIANVWADDYSSFVMASVTDNGVVNKNGDREYKTEGKDYGLTSSPGFCLDKNGNVLMIPTLTVQRLAARVDFKVSYLDQVYDKNSEAPNYTGVLTAMGKDKVMKVVCNGNVNGSDNWKPQFMYEFKNALDDGNYTLTIKVKSDDAQSGSKVQIEYNQASSGQKWSGAIEPGSEWTELSVTGSKPSNFRINMGVFKGTLLISEVSLVKEGDTENKMPNPDFEVNNLDNWKWENNWENQGVSFEIAEMDYPINVGVLYPVKVAGAESNLVFLLESVQLVGVNGGSTYAVPHFNTDGSYVTTRWFGRLNGEAATSDGGYNNGLPQATIVTPDGTTSSSAAVGVFDINSLTATGDGYHLLSYVKEYRNASAPTSIRISGRLFKNKDKVLTSKGKLNIYSPLQNATFTAPLAHRDMAKSTDAAGLYNMVVRNTVYRVTFSIDMPTNPLTDVDDDEPTNPDQTGSTDYSGAVINIDLDGTVSTGTTTGNTPLD